MSSPRWLSLFIPLVLLQSLAGFAVPATAGTEPASPPGPSARIVPDPDSPKLKGLEWKTLEPPLRITRDSESTRVSVLLEGRYRVPGSSLAIQGQAVDLDPDGAFSIELPVERKATAVSLLVTGADGKRRSSGIGILLSDFPQVLVTSVPLPKRNWTLVAGISGTYLTYSQPNHSVSSIASTAKVAWSYAVAPSKIDVGLSWYFTAIPFALRDSNQIFFMGLNLRAGYVVPGVDEPWRLSLLGGVYFISIYTPSLDIGNQNLLGPQLFPVLRRSLEGGRSISGYVKYSPVLAGGGSFDLGSREIALGASYSFPLPNGHPLSFSTDISTLNLNLSNGAVSDSTLSFGIGYSF